MSETFLYTTPVDPLARPLIEELTHEYDARYGEFYQQDGSPREMEKYPPEVFAPPEGNFLLLLRQRSAIAGGAFKRLDEQTAEIKRMWTHSALRRQGLARLVIAELEAQALRQGYSRVFLTTGFRQPEAVGLYLSYGYTPLYDPAIEPIVHRKLPFEKDLLARPPAYAAAGSGFAAAASSPL